MTQRTSEVRLLEDVEKFSAREHWSAWALIGALFVEVLLALIYSEGKTVKTALEVSASLIVGIAVLGEVWFAKKADLARDGLKEYADERERASKEKIAQLEKEAADARLETARLKGLSAWRRLTLTQSQFIVENLRNNVSEKVWVVGLYNDPEAEQFHSDVAETMRSAGIDIQWFTGLEQCVGLWVTNGHGASGLLIKKAFASCGFILSDRIDRVVGKDEDGRIEVVIGSKPPNFFTSESGPVVVNWQALAQADMKKK